MREDFGDVLAEFLLYNPVGQVITFVLGVCIVVTVAIPYLAFRFWQRWRQP